MAANKRLTMLVVAVVAAALILAAAVVGRQYYQDRYVSADYYTMVPLDHDVTPEMIYASDGQEMGLGKEYALTVYSPEGEHRAVVFTVFTPESGMAAARPLPQPGDFLHVMASRTIVTGWRSVARHEIPPPVLKHLGAHGEATPTPTTTPSKTQER